MAGLPSHPKKSSKSGSGRSTKQTIGKEPTVGQEELESVGRSRSRPKGRSNAASNLQQQEGASEGSAPWKRESSVQSSSSGSGSDLLWITADKPAVFKDANIKKLISRHVMRDFQSKDQSGKDPSQAPKMKKMAIRPSSSESTLQRVTSHPSQIDIASGHPISTPSTHSLGSELVKGIYYPLDIDHSFFELQDHLIHLLQSHINVWFREHASRIFGSQVYEVWPQWLPSAHRNETLLYAQAFAAVVHVNFLNPEVYKAERWVLKGQAIHKINDTLNSDDAADDDANIGAVLCLALVATFENLGVRNYTAHMLGLEKMVAMRGGMQALSSNKPLHAALCLCDVLGAIIFRSGLALLFARDSHARASSQLRAKHDHDILDSPLQCYGDVREPPGYSGVSADTTNLLDALCELTRIFDSVLAGKNFNDTARNEWYSTVAYHRLEVSSVNGSPIPRTNDDVYEACRFAGVIYVRALFRGTPFASARNFQAVRMLRELLKKMQIDDWNRIPGVFLWVLLVGRAAEREACEDAFLAGCLSTTAMCCIPLWGVVMKTLERFLWLEQEVEERALSLMRGAEDEDEEEDE